MIGHQSEREGQVYRDQEAYLVKIDSREPLIGNNPTQSIRVYENGRGWFRLPQEGMISIRFRKMVALVLMVVAVACWTWLWFIRPQYVAEKEIMEGFTANANATYEVEKSTKFDGTRLASLDPSLVPGGLSDPDGRRRLVFVGDIHGCLDELQKLLKKVEFNEKKDHLVAVGDVISKGPDNVGVLDELMKLGASIVRGNHEDRILAIAPTMSEIEPPAELLSKGAAKDRKLIKHFTKKHIGYLERMPLMLRVPALPLAIDPSYKTSSPIAEEILVVHAGLVPSITLDKQDPYFVMNMRSIRTKNHLPLAEADVKGSKPWNDIWEWYNDRLFRKKSVKDFGIWDSIKTISTTGWFGQTGLKKKKDWPLPQVVIYGHHSKAGLQIGRWSKGLDTGCVRGGKLTAMVLNADGTWDIMSVGCRDHR